MFEAVHTQLSEVTAAGKSRAELETGIGELSRIEAHAVERRLALTAAIDDLHDGGIDGENVTRVRAGRSKRAAHRASKTASLLKEMPRTRKALADGAITEEHANAAAAAAEAISAGEVDEELAADATKQPADRFARQVRSWTNRREQQDRAQARQNRQREAREGRIWVNPDGMVCLYGQFDPVEGQTLRKAFVGETERLWREDGGRDGTPNDIRTPDQRGADAITNLLAAATRPLAAQSPDTTASKQPHPKYQVFVRVDADRLRADHPTGVAEFADGTPLPQASLERIACDAAFTGAIFDTDGAVLWQGRRQRVATDDQWRALIGRDGGCVICAADPAHCQAHHLDPWAPPTKGNTDINRLVLVCNQDHHLIHDQNYSLANTAGRWQLKSPRTGQRSPRAPATRAA